MKLEEKKKIESVRYGDLDDKELGILIDWLDTPSYRVVCKILERAMARYGEKAIIDSSESQSSWELSRGVLMKVGRYREMLNLMNLPAGAINYLKGKEDDKKARTAK